jgi:lipoyl synthase
MPDMPKPRWLKRSIGSGEGFTHVRDTINGYALHTVCEEARCPNRGECYSAGTATFMILGEKCTRSCLFCAVSHGTPAKPEDDEPSRVAEAVQKMGLSFVVITSVTRDDLPDGGSRIFAATIRAIRKKTPNVPVEVLIPDFKGSEASLEEVCEAGPTVVGHNVETVPRLYPVVRSHAKYHRSLDVLSWVSERYTAIQVKSGIMCGLGETTDELRDVFADLRKCGCDFLTIGQYLQPDKSCVPVARYITPDEFGELAEIARAMGFRHVASGPFVRSSYHAAEAVGIVTERV